MVDMQLIVPRINIPLFQMKLYSRERLEAAFLILSGIPRENINLRKWRDGRGPNVRANRPASGPQEWL